MGAPTWPPTHMGAPTWPPNPQRSGRPGVAGAALDDPDARQLTRGPPHRPQTPDARPAPATPSRSSMTLAFVGLGAMGSRLARLLLEAKHPVTGYNRTAAKARALEAAGLKLAPSPRAAVEGAVAVFSMVTDDAALRAVALGKNGIVAGLGRGAVWAEMSTVIPTVTRELGAPVAARCAAMPAA